MKCVMKVLTCFLVFVPAVLSYKYRRERTTGERLKIWQARTIDPLQSESSVPRETSRGPIAINFETEDNVIQEVKYRMKGTPACDSLEGELGFCVNDQEYNATIVKLFNEIMKTSPLHNLITDVLNETVIPIDKSALQPHLRNRIGFSSEQTLCPSVETIIYPKRGQTASKDWVFILNQGPVQQGVKVEKCLQPNSPCKLGGGPLEQTSCRQKYIYKKLLAMDTSGNNIVSESIYMPSCCVCYVSNDFVSLRSAGGSSGIQAKSSFPTM